MKHREPTQAQLQQAHRERHPNECETLDDMSDVALGCETVEDYCARWRSVAEAMADES